MATLPAPLRGDRAIIEAADDRLGLDGFAQRLATAISSQAADNGLVIGIEGRWGAGKSSLLALTLAHLRTRPDEAAVVEFRPWLIGDRDQLLSALFDDLSKTIAAIEHEQGDATRTTNLAAKDVAERARRFARHLGPVGKLAGLAGLAIPGAATLGQLITGLAEAAAQDPGGPALSTQKDDLARDLASLGRRIVVTVDDVDRLEPKEVAEVLRLVRSVADFPNVVYVLCYDGDALAKAIQLGTGADDGRAYLEKIVQTEFGVPRPESFALRRWFSTELATFAACDGEVGQRLSHVIDTAGGRGFDTARTVVRVLDSLRVFWPALAGKVDLADLVWVRLLAVTAPNTHRWIEEYVDANAAVAIGRASVSGRERVEVGRKLDRALELDGTTWKAVQFEFNQHLPGIGYGKPEDDSDGRILCPVPAYEQAKAVRVLRLASPDHGRLYFALAAAAGTVRADEVDDVLAAALRSAGEVTERLIAWQAERSDAGTSKAERLLDHFGHLTPHALVRTDAEQLALGVSDAADTMAEGREDEWGSPRPWFLAKALLAIVRAHQEPDRWARTIGRLAAESRSMGFLTYVFRAETFAHGVYGDRPDPQDRLTTRQEFDVLRDAMLQRYRELGLHKVMEHPSGRQMLYAWSQGGGRSELVAEIESQAGDLRWPVVFLQHIFSSTRSSEGEHASLSPDAIANFFDDVPTLLERMTSALEAGDDQAGTVVRAVTSSLRFDGPGEIRRWIDHQRRRGATKEEG